MTTASRTKQTAIALVAVIATFISACSTSGSSGPETVTVTEAAGGEVETPAEEQPATEAAPATFDRNDPDFEFFELCEELTNEDLADFGLLGMFENADLDRENLMSSCGLRELNPSDWIETSVMAMAGISVEELRKRTRAVPSSGTPSLPGSITFTAAQETSELTCDAAVPTEGGTLWITYGIFREGVYSHSEVCDRALNYLGTIHSIVEKKL